MTRAASREPATGRLRGPQREKLALAAFVLFAGLLAGWAVAISGHIGVLTLLVIPALSMAFFYPRRVTYASFAIGVPLAVVIAYGVEPNFPATLFRIFGLGAGSLGVLEFIHRTVSDRDAEQSARRESEERFHALTQHRLDLVSEATQGGTITYASPNHEFVTGFTPQELVGRPLTETIYRGDWRLIAERIPLENQSPLALAPIRIRAVCKDGSLRWIEGRIQRYERADGEQRFLCVSRDIGEQKQAQDELLAHREQLEGLVTERTRELTESQDRLRLSERLASMGTLAAGIAHQINNPVGSILAGAQYALMCENDEDEREVWKRALEDNVAQAARCGEIVRSVLQFSRDEPHHKRPVDLNEILRRAGEQAVPAASRRSCHIRLELDERPLPVLMSAIEMEQVFVNLLNNAIESRNEGAKVQLRSGRSEGLAHVEVCDDGRGISDEHGKRIFDPFFTTRLDEGGTGLGLSVAHGLIEEHRGKIRADSKPGEGTAIVVEFPLAEERALDGRAGSGI